MDKTVRVRVIKEYAMAEFETVVQSYLNIWEGEAEDGVAHKCDVVYQTLIDAKGKVLYIAIVTVKECA